MARRTQTPKLLNLCEFIKSKIIDSEATGKKTTFGALKAGIWQEYKKGKMELLENRFNLGRA